MACKIINQNTEVKDLLKNIHQLSQEKYYDDEILLVPLENTTPLSIHGAILKNVSKYLNHILLNVQKYEEFPLYILLKDFKKKCLQNFCHLIYRGYCDKINGQDCDDLMQLCNVLGVNISFNETTNQKSINQGDKKISQDIDDDFDQCSKKKRILMAELDPSELTCKECGKRFPYLYKLKIHLLIHSKTTPFHCDICNKGFNNKYKMRAHQKKNHYNSQFDYQSKSVKAVTNQKVKKKHCPNCDQSFNTKLLLVEHVKIMHPEAKMFSCRLCKKRFKGNKGLQHHITYVCVKDKNKFSCSICGAKVSSPKALKKHLLTHSSKEEWRCSNCSITCSSRNSLKAHQLASHSGEDSELPYRCIHCGKGFIKLSYLEDHFNRFHCSIKPFPCDLCPKRCSTKQDLDRHLRSHKGKAEFQCQYCSKTFVHRTTYTQHIRAHMGIKPYKCIPCDKSFSMIGILKKHFEYHQNKGDHTEIIKAPKGRRGCISYIDVCRNKNLNLIKQINPKDNQTHMDLTYTDMNNQHEAIYSHDNFQSQNLRYANTDSSMIIDPLRPREYMETNQYIQCSSNMNTMHPMDVYNNQLTTYDLNNQHNPMNDTMTYSNYPTDEKQTTEHQDLYSSHSNYQLSTPNYTNTANPNDELNENEAIAMDIMGLFTDTTTQGTENRIDLH